ncbi:sensor histidine kinase [Roseateles koreensis]|uniref:histidine kinase n=1 Tax=Roseateles koreensis TaxID=2987526 RepID=A0ABT5KVF0_9BURK|nr:HAMP domain-containing sensor histidine kinase [Roseateles koreensis]MDC8786410.1 HAMP domain-containing sensor histidine kinase [Roseateles koreensis]
METVTKYRRQALASMQGALLLGILVASTQFLHDPIVFGVMGLGMLASLLSLLLAFKGISGWATCIFGLQLLVMPPVLSLHETGMYDSAMYLVPVSMVLMAAVGRARFVWAFNSLVVLSTLGVIIATTHGVNGQRLSADPPLNEAADGAAILIIIVLCGFATGYLSLIMQRMLDVIRGEQELLEARVNSRTQDLEQALVRMQRIQDELVHSEKLASLGSLVAGISHELNTPIGNALIMATSSQERIRSLRQMMLAGPLRKSSLENYLHASEEMADLLVRAIERSATLIASFKQVAVDQTSERRREFNLLEVLHSVVDTLRAGIKHQPWTFHIEADAGIACDSYPGPLGQILTNLVQNALRHGFNQRNHGTVWIDVRLVDDEVWLQVRDDGHGMDPGVLARVFDPFFTTQLGQGGSGLGLAICRRLATSVLGGDLTASSVSGEGACFTLRFPRVAPGQI